MHAVTPAGALVGRDSEMALLTGLIREVARGRGSSVLIEGEPGIGKSALVRAATAAASEAGCEVFWGAGDELGQALPLLPFLDGLRVREPSTNPRRNAIVQLLRGEVSLPVLDIGLLNHEQLAPVPDQRDLDLQGRGSIVWSLQGEASGCDFADHLAVSIGAPRLPWPDLLKRLLGFVLVGFQ